MQTCVEFLINISKITDFRGDEGAVRMKMGHQSVPKSGLETTDSKSTLRVEGRHVLSDGFFCIQKWKIADLS